MAAEERVANNFEKYLSGVSKKAVILQRKTKGVLAQLVERLNGIQKVRSSILLCSTTNRCNSLNFSGFLFLS